MRTQKTSSLNVHQRIALLFALAFTSIFIANHVRADEVATPTARVEHAKELLGKSYKKKVLKKTRDISAESEVSDFISSATAKFLPKKFKSKATSASKAIIAASEKYDLDPVFLMAMILNESSFNPRMKGSAGEIGLMQIKPSTAAWLSKIYKLKYKNAQSLYDPSINIWLGAAFIDKLRHQFDSQSQLYLSAYNIGAKKVRSMVSENNRPKEYVQAVMKRYMALYSGFRIEGSAKEQSEVAWVKTSNLTRKN